MCTDICRAQFSTLNSNFSAWSKPSSYKKIVAQRGRLQPFLYICCNLGEIFCTGVIPLFSVVNMEHKQLKKCSKYDLLVIFFDEKLFAHFYSSALLNP